MSQQELPLPRFWKLTVKTKKKKREGSATTHRSISRPVYFDDYDRILGVVKRLMTDGREFSVVVINEAEYVKNTSRKY